MDTNEGCSLVVEALRESDCDRDVGDHVNCIEKEGIRLVLGLVSSASGFGKKLDRSQLRS